MSLRTPLAAHVNVFGRTFVWDQYLGNALIEVEARGATEVRLSVARATGAQTAVLRHASTVHRPKLTIAVHFRWRKMQTVAC